MNVMKMMVMKTKTKRKLVLKMILMMGNGEYGAIRSIFQSKLNPHENSHILQRKLQGWVRCSNHPARRERRSNFKKTSLLLPSRIWSAWLLVETRAFMSSSVSNLNSPWHAQQAEHCVRTSCRSKVCANWCEFS